MIYELGKRQLQWRFRCPLKSEASLSSLFQLSGDRLRDIT